MDPLILFIIVGSIAGFLLGAVVGLFIARRGKESEELPEESAASEQIPASAAQAQVEPPVPLTKRSLEEYQPLICLWRRREKGDLAIEIKGKLYPTPDDFAVTLEKVGDEDSTTIIVVGAWETVDQVQGWQLSVCHEEGKGTIDDCHLEPIANPDTNAVEPPCEACPNIVCTDDFLNAGGPGVTFAMHMLNIYSNGFTQAVVPSLTMAWTLPPRDRFEMIQVTYDVNEGEEMIIWVCGDPDGLDDILGNDDDDPGLGEPPIDTAYRRS